MIDTVGPARTVAHAHIRTTLGVTLHVLIHDRNGIYFDPPDLFASRLSDAELEALEEGEEHVLYEAAVSAPLTGYRPGDALQSITWVAQLWVPGARICYGPHGELQILTGLAVEGDSLIALEEAGAVPAQD